MRTSTIIHFTCKLSINDDIFRIFVEAGLNLNVKDFHEETPLHWMASNKKVTDAAADRIIKHLISRGVNINAKNTKQGRSALHLAMYTENLMFSKKLLKFGADVNITDDNNKTPLIYLITEIIPRDDGLECYEFFTKTFFRLPSRK